ncbi:DgyrCDS14662 [Dimorphilus gyrociliatus]|uniref:DgyrCDS14662 n=1 Tax=Dimorphilus gyrociliatus TaxID=2664684 RepID=A0A7I8WEK7_9ANNE|nr:DgyrCDS14662 [Dimorphilus gyrociliatus]
MKAGQMLKSRHFWKSILAEFLAVLLLIVIGCSSCKDEYLKPNTVRISLGFGFTIAILVGAISHISGGHLNPAVSLGLFIARRCEFLRFIFYSIAQVAGAIVGAAILKGIHGKVIGTTEPSVSSAQGFAVELIITFVLVFVVLACTDSKRSDSPGPVPLIVGLTIISCHLFAVDVTGAAMNPARAIGPALIASKWGGHWIYWAGSLLGGVLSAIMYEYIFASDSSVQKLRAAIPLKKKAAIEPKESDEKSKEGNNENLEENKVELQAVNIEE